MSEERTGAEAGVSPKGAPARRAPVHHRAGLSSPGDNSEGAKGQRDLVSVEHATHPALHPHEGDSIGDQREGGTDIPEADRRPGAVPSGDISCLGTCGQPPGNQTNEEDVVPIHCPRYPFLNSILGGQW